MVYIFNHNINIVRNAITFKKLEEDTLMELVTYILLRMDSAQHIQLLDGATLVTQ